MPKVSILLTCFNHIRFLPECWRGVQVQTFRDFEVIAIDDGSSDGTREWLQEKAKDARLIFNENNLGTYASLNRALQEANGDFVAILNDDDTWAPTKLEAQLQLFEDHPDVALVHTDGSFIDANGKIVEGSPLGFEFPRTETGNALLALMYANKIIASAALVRKKCFEELGRFNESYFGSGDWEMWMRIAERWDVGYIDEELTFYRVHGENASHKLERIWQDDEMLRLWIRSKYSDYEKLDLDPEDFKQARAHNEACLGTVMMLNGKSAESRAAYRESLRLDPTRFKSRLRLLATYMLPRPLWKKVL